MTRDDYAKFYPVLGYPKSVPLVFTIAVAYKLTSNLAGAVSDECLITRLKISTLGLPDACIAHCTYSNVARDNIVENCVISCFNC